MTAMNSSLKITLALAAAGLGVLAGCTPRTRVVPARSPSGLSQTAAADQAAASLRAPVASPEAGGSYAEIAERNMFRPLVAVPKGPEGAPAPPSTKALEGAGKNASGPKTPSSPPKPPDPLADLALTGVIQTGPTLQALIEHVSTRMGRYLAVGEVLDGFRVKSIQATSVVLEKGGKEYTLRMGEKQLPSNQAAPPPGSGGGGPGPGDPPQPSDRSRFRGGGGGMDMTRWADRMSLAQVEQMYNTYKDRMTPEQRARTEEYIQRRRAQGR